MTPNPAVDPARFALWTLRDEAAQRRSPQSFAVTECLKWRTMKRLRIYVDTSVFGGCLDQEFAEWSNALMDDFRSDHCVLVVSDVTAGGSRHGSGT